MPWTVPTERWDNVNLLPWGGDGPNLVGNLRVMNSKFGTGFVLGGSHKDIPQAGIQYTREAKQLCSAIFSRKETNQKLLKKVKANMKEKFKKKMKNYQEIILQKYGIISKLEKENQKLLKEKMDNLPLNEEKEKTRNLEENLRKVERLNR